MITIEAGTEQVTLINVCLTDPGGQPPITPVSRPGPATLLHSIHASDRERQHDILARWRSPTGQVADHHGFLGAAAHASLDGNASSPTPNSTLSTTGTPSRSARSHPGAASPRTARHRPPHEITWTGQR